MRLSVIVPVRNGAAHIGELLDSLHVQHIGAIGACEFIAVDDASTDGTPALLERYPWLQVLRHEVRRGAGAARNTGARAARGDVLIFLDADTRVRDPDFLVRCAAFFDARTDYAAVSGCYYDQNPRRNAFARYLDASEAAMRSNALDRPASGCLSAAVCGVRRKVFLDLGGFSEDPRVVLEDPDLGSRLAAAGHRHWFSGDLRVEHRQPGLWHYARELVPRTRHYLHLIRHHRAFNPVMGGRQEGVGRAGLALGLPCLVAGLLAPLAGYVGALLLATTAWQVRGLLQRLLKSEGLAFFPAAFVFHVLTTAAIVAGGLLGVGDAARFTIRRRVIDGAVVLAYLRSLLTRGAPGYLIQFLTHRCNARCGHCFDEPQRRKIGIADEMDLPRIRRLAATTGPLGHLSLTGGEPLLRNDIADIVAAYYQAGVRSFSLSTNGSYPERLANLLKSLETVAPRGRMMVTISVDGVGAQHDRLRGLAGLYAKVEESFRVLVEARQWLPQLRVHACIAITRGNIGYVDHILDRLQPLHLDQLEMTRLRGVPADAAIQGVDDATYDTVSARVAAANGGARGLARLFARLDRAMFTIVRQPATPWPCGTCLAGRRLAVIHADGTVLPCEMLRDVRPGDARAHDDFTLGRLAEHGDDLGALLASRQARHITRYIRDTQCRCSFECAVFATMVYRPWSLVKFFLPGYSPRPGESRYARSAGYGQIIPLCNAVDTNGIPKKVKNATTKVPRIINALASGGVRNEERRCSVSPMDSQVTSDHTSRGSHDQ